MAAADVATWSQKEITSLPSGKKDHNLCPSKVVHCRAIAEGCRETDLVQVLKVFGNIKALKLMPKISQGLVEFEELESAIACVTYNNAQPLVIHGRQMYVNYSKSSEISREFNLSAGQPPTKMLLLTIINVIHPVNVDTIKKICEQQSVEAQRIVIFHKNGLQAFVEFKTVEEACKIQQDLNGCDIYPGCCTLKIEFSKVEHLNVHSNTTESFNIDIKPDNAMSSRRSSDISKLRSEIPSLLAGYESLPAIQNIISRVLAGGSMNDMCSNDGSNRNKSSNSSTSSFSNNRTTLLPDNYITQNPPQSHQMDQLVSPFTSLCVANNPNGGIGCVAMIYGIDKTKINCDYLFNLFCLYGNVVKVKILVNKPGCAMVQYADRRSTDIAIQNLNNIKLFGGELQITFSKHPHIAESLQMPYLDDGKPSVASYHDSRNNRFRYLAGGKNDFAAHIHPPCKVLHYFNAPPTCTEEHIIQLFRSHDIEVPTKQVAISRPNGKSASGLLEFASISQAAEALVLLNHVTLHKDNTESAAGEKKPGAPYTFKLAFSASDSVNLH